MPAQGFDVFNQMRAGIGMQAATGLAKATTALIEQNDPETLWVKQTPVTRRATAARPSVKEEQRNAFRISALLVVQTVTVAHV